MTGTRTAPEPVRTPTVWRPRWVEPAGFLAVLAAYVVVHVVLRVALSPTVTIDDSREAVLAQTLEWGYFPRQPPLYNWLVWAAFQVFGPGVLGLTVVKYLVLAAAYAFVYASGYRILANPLLPPLAAFSLLLMVPIGWVVHETLTHTIAALAAAAATFYALVRLGEAGTRSAYLWFGLALAAGLLSKFSFSLFGAALVLAALTVEGYRARLVHPRILLTVVTAAVALAPFGLWFYGHEFSLVRIYAEEVDPGEPDPYLRGIVSALYYIVRVSAYYLAPLWLLFVALFPGTWRASAAAPPPGPAERLLARFFLAELGIVVAGALVAGVTYLKFRWLMPAYFLFPLYVCCRLDRRSADPGRLRRLAGILVLTALGAAAAFVVNIHRGDALGRPSPLTAPYDTLARRIATAGFTQGTIVAGEGPVAGNLRFWFPRARVLRLANPDYVPPGERGGQCLVVWEKERSERLPPELRQWLATALGATLPADLPGRAVEATYRHARRYTLRIHYVLLPDGAGRCR